jgi:uncharacterized protein
LAGHGLTIAVLDGADAALGLWAGRLPLTATWGTPVPDPLLAPGIEPLPHIAGRIRQRPG